MQFALAKKNYEDLLHDMNTSLSIIYAYVQMLEKDLETSKAMSKYVSSIKTSCHSMMRQISDANHQSATSKSDLMPHYRNCDIVALLREMVAINASLAERKKTELVFSTDVPYKKMAVDKTMLERIVQNLLTNAIKFTDDYGKIEILLVDKGSKITLIVRDNGIGIAGDLIDKVFERYHYSKGERNEFGSGIGLAIVKELTSLMEGEIDISSGGEGTQVRIELPAFVID